jgi:hypothetical protein
MPSPHTGRVQAGVQASSATSLPSSQLLVGLDDRVAAGGRVQLFEHSSVSIALPSSQGSPSSTTPSPQVLSEQSSLQALPGPLSGPASQASSLTGWKIPSPHCAGVQAAVQASASSGLPSSHSSPAWITPSPQLARVQAAVQASSSIWLPSSHSSPGPTSPSPHTLKLQSPLQALPGPLAGPASHSSPRSIAPSPQNGSGSPVVESSPVEVESSPVEVEVEVPVSVTGLVVVVGSLVGEIDVMSVVPVPVPLIEAVPTVASVVGGAVGSVSPGAVVDVPRPVDASELLAEPATTSSPQPPSMPARTHTRPRFKPLFNRIAAPPRKLSRYLERGRVR